MKKYAEQTLSEFVNSVSSAESMPGGGGCAALAAALGASLGCMTANITLKNGKFGNVSDEVTKLLKNLEAMSNFLMRQIDEDTKSYQPLQKFLAMPKDSKDRQEHLEASLRIACSVPTEVIFTSARCAEQLIALAEICSPPMLSDIAVALELCRAAMRSARHLINANAKSMTDEVFVMTLHRENELIFGETDGKIDACLAKIS